MIDLHTFCKMYVKCLEGFCNCHLDYSSLSLSLSANAEDWKLEEQGDLGGICATLLQATNTKGYTVSIMYEEDTFPSSQLDLISLCSRFPCLSILYLLLECFFFFFFASLCQKSFPYLISSVSTLVMCLFTLPHTHTHTPLSPLVFVESSGFELNTRERST